MAVVWCVYGPWERTNTHAFVATNVGQFDFGDCLAVWTAGRTVFGVKILVL